MKKIFLLALSVSLTGSAVLAVQSSPATSTPVQTTDYEKLDTLIPQLLGERDSANKNLILGAINRIPPEHRVTVLEKVVKNADARTGQQIATMIDDHGKNL